MAPSPNETALRRNRRARAKANVTRCINSIKEVLEMNPSKEELAENKARLCSLRDEAVARHDSYLELLPDDQADDPAEESWISEVEKAVQDCMHTLFYQMAGNSNQHIAATTSTPAISEPSASMPVAISGPSALLVSEPSTQDSVASDPRPDVTASPLASMPGNREYSKSLAGLHIEKAKLPRFDGCITDYITFREEFRTHVGGIPSPTAAMMLRNCLGPGPKTVVRGLGLEYEEMWKELDANYGNPRQVSDAILLELDKVKELREGDDRQFIAYVNMVRASFYVLRQVGRPGDLDNNAMLSRIERKLPYSMKVEWSRHLERSQIQNPMLKDLLEWLDTEKRTRIRTSAAIRTPSNRVHQVAAPVAQQPQWYKCWLCQRSDHWVDQCTKFKSMPVEDRRKAVTEGHACFSCLKRAGNGHCAANCKRRRQCTEVTNGSLCTSFHHPLLHSVMIRTTASAVSSPGDRILPILTVDLLGNNGSNAEGNVLLDSGAEISIIRQDLADKLQLKGTDVVVSITKVGSEEEQYQTKVYNFSVRAQCNASNTIKIKAISLPSISDDVHHIKIAELAVAFQLEASMLRRKGGKVDLLIGIDYPYLHTGETRKNGNLVARKTILGWVVFGKVNGSSLLSGRVFHLARTEPVDLTQFWSTESLGTTVHPCTCDTDKLTRQQRQEAHDLKNSAIKRGQRWEIAYPWEKDPACLPDNRQQAESRLRQLEKRLLKDPATAKEYSKQMDLMIVNGAARKLTNDEIASYCGPVHYVSHHAVLKPDSASTPLRIVFNSSASYKGHTLNDYWKKGPDLLNNLIGVLLRFRTGPTAFVGDISKMFHQICIPELDQHVHRFLWRSLNESQEPDTYVMNVVSFGDKPSPAIANTALRLTAEENQACMPEVSKLLKENVYVDDICCSVPSYVNVECLLKDIDTVLQTGGFKIKQWVSNSKMETSESVKVLGHVWNPASDIVALAKTDRDKSPTQALTKRSVLSDMSKTYDPMGLCAPVVIGAKIAFQGLWRRGISWDEPLSLEETTTWLSIIQNLDDLHQISFDRCLTPANIVSGPDLVIFCDASTAAFGAAAYLRWETNDGSHVCRLIMAKSRVAPLKPMLNIVRLELQAAVIAVRLSQLIKDELQLDLKDTVFLTDSQIVKAMIMKKDAQFKPFFSVRIGEIQELSDGSCWLCIPSGCNVADRLSRGVTVAQLDDVWKYGPPFLELPISEWPTTEQDSTTRDALVLEIRADKLSNSTLSPSEAININRFSNYRRLIRVTARILAMSRRQPLGLKDSIPHEILEEAEKIWLIEAQRGIRDDFKKGNFKSLSPFQEDELIKVGGRADKALMNYDTRHPVLLPGNHWLSFLIAKQEHGKNHDGIATTAERIRRRFWITKVHCLVRKIRNKCVDCKKLSARVEEQFMADLPEQRLRTDMPPFCYTAVDLFGPLKVKVGRNKVDKHYGVLFTCMTCRAVHLEVATDYSTEAFLASLRRFFAIRGYPNELRSDRGTQLIGAERELRTAFQNLDWKTLQDYCAEKKMKWIFNTPSAPHMNGVAEALVKSVKRCLLKAIGDAILRPFELYTVLLEIANLVNDRPVGRASTDPDDWKTLCPNDLLLGRASTHVPQGPFRETRNPRERFLVVQGIVSSFWKRWTRDTFPSLLPRKKWATEKRNVRVGDIVVVADYNSIRGKWTLGRILEVFPGKDGRVRNVRVKTGAGQYERPISKICVIAPVEESVAGEGGSGSSVAATGR